MARGEICNPGHPHPLVQPGHAGAPLTLHDGITGIQFTLAPDATKARDLAVVFLLPNCGVYLVPWGQWWGYWQGQTVPEVLPLEPRPMDKELAIPPPAWCSSILQGPPQQRCLTFKQYKGVLIWAEGCIASHLTKWHHSAIHLGYTKGVRWPQDFIASTPMRTYFLTRSLSLTGILLLGKASLKVPHLLPAIGAEAHPERGSSGSGTGSRGSHQVPAAGAPGIGAADQQPLTPPLQECDIVVTVLFQEERWGKKVGWWKALAVGPSVLERRHQKGSAQVAASQDSPADSTPHSPPRTDPGRDHVSRSDWGP